MPGLNELSYVLSGPIFLESPRPFRVPPLKAVASLNKPHSARRDVSLMRASPGICDER